MEKMEQAAKTRKPRTKKPVTQQEPVKEPEKQPDKVKIIVDDKAVTLQVLELNKLAWKVLHQLNAALTGEAEIE